MKTISSLLLAGLGFSLAVGSHAADAKPPASEVIARFLEAIGGKDAVLKHTSMAIKGKFDMGGLGQGDFEMLKAKPNRQLFRIKLGDQGQIVNGFDGKVGWTVNPFTGAMLLEGKLLAQTADEAEFYSILHRDSDLKSIETVGSAQVDGKDCVELKVVTKSGREVREFFDAKTGLLVATKSTQESPQGAAEVTLIFTDYKKFDDLMQATRIKVQTAGMEQTLTISSVEYDKVPDKEFDLPADVQALIRK